MAQATNEGRALSGTASTTRADGIAEAITATVGALKRRIDDPEAHTRAFLLGHVARLEPVRATELAEAVHLDLSTISRHLRGLEESGLLVRSPDPDDRRASRLAVTPEGRVVLDRTTAARSALFASATAGWTDSEVDDLVRLLLRLSHDLENL